MKAEISVMNSPEWGFPAKSDITVGLNGRRFVIQEGKRVRVPLGVLENLEHAIVRLPRADKETGQLQFDKDGRQIFDEHPRYLVQVFKDPRKVRARNSTKKTEEALENITAELEEGFDEEDVDQLEDAPEEEKRKGILGKIFGTEE